MQAALEREVRLRAAERCEYCHVPSFAYQVPFQIDHIIAQKHFGRTTLENLALACFHCNLHKGPNIAGIDPDTRRVIELFHPRRDVWAEHFQLLPSGEIVGRTPIGRVTVLVLEMNDADPIAVRRRLTEEGISLF
jgi:hypothetical protein